VPRRVVTPIDQHVHNYLGAILFMVLSFGLVLHCPQFSALLGANAEAPDFSLTFKDPPLSMRYIVGLPSAFCVTALWRGTRERIAGPLSSRLTLIS